jgi:hypothetical protein
MGAVNFYIRIFYGSFFILLFVPTTRGEVTCDGDVNTLEKYRSDYFPPLNAIYQALKRRRKSITDEKWSKIGGIVTFFRVIAQTITLSLDI